MPKVAADNSPLLDRAIFGYDGADYRVVKVDTDGNLVAALKADQNVQARGYGYDGSAWQKLALLFGYSDVVSQVVTQVPTTAGTNTLVGSTVPSGEVWVVTSALAQYVGTSPTAMYLLPSIGSASPQTMRQANPVSQQGYAMSGTIVLKAGDKMQMLVEGATAGDQAYLHYNGYKMEVA